MKLRIAHTQTLLLLSAVLITVLCMGALNAWNLRNGFSEFLVSRDTERLENFANLHGWTAFSHAQVVGLWHGGAALRTHGFIAVCVFTRGVSYRNFIELAQQHQSFFKEPHCGIG